MTSNLCRFSTIVVATLILFLLPGFVSSQSLPDSDFQIWNETVLSFPVVKTKDDSGKESDKLSLLVIGVLRLGQNRLFPVDARVGAGFDLKLNKYLSFTPTYVYRRGEPIRGIKEYEHRIRFDVTAGHKWKRFSLKDRNRVEYRARNSRGDSVRYRNKVTVAVPVTSDGKEIVTPFAAEEIYYDFSAKQFTTNEFSAGFSKKLSKNTSAEFFYLRRDFRGLQVSINGIGVNLKIRID